jgi:hypothetical protein
MKFERGNNDKECNIPIKRSYMKFVFASALFFREHVETFMRQEI